MSNLKKILALVLSLVMTFSVMSVASAAQFTDGVSAEYTEAVELLNAIGVFRGYEDGTFKPQNSITRAEVAAIIYRIDTGDVKDEQVKIYSDYNRFADVDSKAWYAGYVNYCANAEYVKGYDENTFGPNDKVTGYQALAMILRVVGYDQNDEFSGSAWQIEVAKYANKLGVTANVSANTLGVAATRELIAELLWRTIYTVPQVTYTPALGYNQYKDLLDKNEANLNKTINEEKFGITYFETYNDWNQPVYGWRQWGRTIISRVAAAYYTTYTAVTECEISRMLGVTAKADEFDIEIFENTDEAVVYEHLNVDHTSHKNNAHLIGEQGTQFQVFFYWDDPATPGINESYIPYIVLIDTYLAVVADYTTEKVDKFGCVTREATTDLYVYGLDEIYTISGNDYVEDGYVLVRVNEDPTPDRYTATQDEFCKVTGLPNIVEGKQTKIHWNEEKHTIEGANYDDNVNYALDEAGYDQKNTFYWLFDANNFVIGSIKPYVASYLQYAVVHSAQWINGTGVKGFATANVQYMNQEVADIEIEKVNGEPVAYADANNVNFSEGKISTTLQLNLAQDLSKHLYKVTDADNDGKYELNVVTPELATVTVKDGVPMVDSANGVIADNNTIYVVRHPVTKALTFYVGMDNLPKETYGKDADIVIGRDGFADIIFFTYTGTSDEFEYKYMYITDDASTAVLDEEYTVMTGVVDVTGNTDPLLFFGGDLATQAYVDNMAKLYENTLVKVQVYKGTNYVVDVTAVMTGSDNGNTTIGKALYLGAGEGYFAATGTLVFTDANGDQKAINVNTATTIVNDDGVGMDMADLMLLLDEDYNTVPMYVVYNKYDKCIAIFVTTTVEGETTPFEAFFSTLTADDFDAETNSIVYTIDADAEEDGYATVDEFVYSVIEDSAVNTAFLAAGEELTVASFSTEIATDDYRNKYLVVELTLTYGEEQKTIELVFNAK